MTQRVNAIYVRGVLRPLEPLYLAEQEIVSISVDKVVASGANVVCDSPTLFDLLDAAGLIGCIKDAPSDLSTNPQFMEGFGRSSN